MGRNRTSTRARATTALAACLALVTLAAACGGSDDTEADTPGTTTAEVATTTTAVAIGAGGETRTGTFEPDPADPSTNRAPIDVDPTGEIRIAYAAVPTNLDPLLDLNPIYTHPVYDTLTEMYDDYTVHPRLARSWSYPDATTLRLELRQGVAFHDGTPFDAAAVKVNLDRYRNDPLSIHRASLASISNIVVVDDHTVDLQLKGGGAQLPIVFTKAPGMMVSPTVLAADPASVATEGAGGSGSYVVEDFRPSELVSYAPNPDFWNKTQGLLGRMTILGITSGAQRMNALKAGDVDLAQVIGADTAAAKQELASGSLQGVQANLTGIQNVVLLRDSLPPFDDAKVREAVAYAINKQGLVDGLYRGACTPGAQFFPQEHWAHDPALEGTYTFDPAKARQLLAESGVTDLAITLDYISLYQAPAEAVQAMLQDVGFEVALHLAEPGDFGFRDGQREMSVGTIINIYDPSQLVANYLTGGSKLLGDAPGVAQLAEEGADPAGSIDTWKAAYDQLWELTFGEHRIIPTCNSQHVWAHLGEVANPEDIRYKFSGTVDFTRLYVAK